MPIQMDFEKKKKKQPGANHPDKFEIIFETARSNFETEILSPGPQSRQTSVTVYWLSNKLDNLKVAKSVSSNLVSTFFVYCKWYVWICMLILFSILA